MRGSNLCLGVLVLLLIANCEAKNEESKGEGPPPDDEYYYAYYVANDTNQHTIGSSVGSGDHTTPSADDEEHHNNYFANDTNQHTIGSNVGSGDHTTPSADDEKHYSSRVWDSSADAPAFKVTINGSNENNQTAVLVCDARSVPGAITFSPWVHMWGGRVIRDGLQGRNDDHINLLIINNLSLRDMGTYICVGESEINGTKMHIESANLKVTGLPTILFETSIFSGKIGQPVNISIPFYSNPSVERFYIRANGTILPNTSDVSIDLVDESVDYLMYGKTVKLEAQILQFVILNLSQRHFDNYTLLLTNPLGHKEFTFQLLLFENTGRLSAALGLLVVGVVALLIAGTGVIITVILIKTDSKGKQSREESEPGTENTPVNIIYVLAGEVTSEQEYLRGKPTDDSSCSEIPGQQSGEESEPGCPELTTDLCACTSGLRSRSFKIPAGHHEGRFSTGASFNDLI